MEDHNSHNWLPPGWTMEVRVRKNGKRDKYYFPPSNELKFNSKVEVFRYLDNAQNKVIVEKAIAEVLQPGWVKKTRIATKGNTVRRDTSANGTMKPILSASMGQSSDLDMIVNDQQISNSASSGEYSNQCVVGAELASSVLSETENSDQKQGKLRLAQRALVSICTNEDAQKKQLQENSGSKHGTEKAQAQDRQFKNKHKKEINLPRRASKRLAGIKVDPFPELKTRNKRGRPVAVNQSGEEETITTADRSPNSMPDGLAKQFNASGGGSEFKYKSEKHIEKILEVQSNKHKECFSFSPQENNDTVEVCGRVLENEDEVDAKLDYTLDFPLRELLTDPCIAFAIQTLTGVTFAASKTSQTSFELQNNQHPKSSSATAICGKTDLKAKNENAGQSSDKTLDMSWMDPCIEFAIKTLTDTVDSDQNTKNCLQQQLSSPSTQHSEMALASVSLDNKYQTDHYCSQYFGTQKPMCKESFVDQSLQHTINIGIGNSAGARLSHCGEDTRRNVC